jgi:PAS domain-containing protein
MAVRAICLEIIGGCTTMEKQEIELILSRHWSSHLNMPIFLVDPQGNLLFYNEPAEPILGRRFAETGVMTAEEWSTIFDITDEDNQLLDPSDLPLNIALQQRRLAHRRFCATGLDNVRRYIETTCFPLIGQDDRFLGAVAIFWELDD